MSLSVALEKGSICRGPIYIQTTAAVPPQGITTATSSLKAIQFVIREPMDNRETLWTSKRASSTLLYAITFF